MEIIIKRNQDERQSPVVTIDTKTCYYPYAIRSSLELALELDGYDKGTINEVFNQMPDTKCEPAPIEQKEQPIQERIKVTGIYKGDLPDNSIGYSFSIDRECNEMLLSENYTSLCQLIEQSLNKDIVEDKFEKVGKDYWKPYNHDDLISLTKEQLDAMMGSVFNAARELTTGGLVTGYLGTGLKYPTFKDYLQSLPENKTQPSNTNSTTVTEKGWEVLSYNNYEYLGAVRGGGIREKKEDGLFYFTTGINKTPCSEYELLNSHWEIHSVKRLSDGEVFTVGDNNGDKVISGFHDGWNGMEIHYTNGSAGLLLETTKY
jgi:hypothetical protein